MDQTIKISLPHLLADVYVRILCDRLNDEMRWDIIYYSEVRELHIHKGGWVRLCIAFGLKPQAATIFRKLYKNHLLTGSRRSFVLNPVGAILNTYVVTQRHKLAWCMGPRDEYHKFLYKVNIYPSFILLCCIYIS